MKYPRQSWAQGEEQIVNGGAVVADYLMMDREAVWCDITNRMEVQDWVSEELLALLGKLYEMRDLSVGEDYLWWNPTTNVSFWVKSFLSSFG